MSNNAFWLKRYKGGTKPKIFIAIELLERVGKASQRIKLPNGKTRIVKADNLFTKNEF